MQRFTIEAEHGPDLEFEGEQLVHQQSELLGMVEVWRTAGGRYVVRRRRHAHRGRPYFCGVETFDRLDALGAWLGSSQEAKRILQTLGQRSVARID